MWKKKWPQRTELKVFLAMVDILTDKIECSWHNSMKLVIGIEDQAHYLMWTSFE